MTSRTRSWSLTPRTAEELAPPLPSGRAEASEGTSRWLVAAIAAAGLWVTGLGVYAAFLRPANPDIAWFYHVAQRVAAGEALYVDILETNPPLVIWLNLPLTWLAELTGVPDLLLVFGATVAFLLLAAGLSVWILLGPLDPEPLAGATLALAILFALFVLPGGDFGQREHLFLAALMPYLVLSAARLTGTARGAGGRHILIGVVAGLGIALKPHFVAAWLAAEAFIWLKLRARASGRPELLGVLLVLTIYAAAVLAFAPQYVALAREYVAPLYPYWLPAPLGAIARSGNLVIAAVALLALLAARPKEWRRALGIPAALVLVAMTGMLFVQQKGFSYHFLTLLALSLLLTVLAVLEAVGRMRAGARAGRVLAWTGQCALLVFLLGGAWLSVGRARGASDTPEQEFRRTVRAVLEEAGNPTVLVLAPGGEVAYPAVVEADARSVSSFYSLWPLAALATRELGWQPTLVAPSADWPELERLTLDRLAADMALRPDLVLVDRRPLATFAGTIAPDFLERLRRDPAFVQAFAGYVRVASTDPLEVWARGRDP